MTSTTALLPAMLQADGVDIDAVHAEDHGRAGSETALLLLRVLHKQGPCSARDLVTFTGLPLLAVQQALRGLKYRGRVKGEGTTQDMHWEAVDPFRSHRA